VDEAALDTGFDVTAADLDVYPVVPPSARGPLSSPVTDIAVLYPQGDKG